MKYDTEELTANLMRIHEYGMKVTEILENDRKIDSKSRGGEGEIRTVIMEIVKDAFCQK